MNDVTSRNFGYLIAYVIPGFVVVVGFAERFAQLGAWLGIGETAGPTVGGFLYASLAAMAAGLIVSALRWLVLDSLHHRTGINPPSQNFRRLERNRRAFYLLVEFHFRYYEFFAHMLIATVAWIVVSGVLTSRGLASLVWPGLALLFLLGLLFVASRDALRKYYDRSVSLLDDRTTN